MDHDAALEQLELAAAEPGGLDRLMAGDTAAAQAVAAHLVGCRSCSDELARLSVASSLVRDALREMPAPELRERTLATVRSEGVARGRSEPPDVAAQPPQAAARPPDVPLQPLNLPPQPSVTGPRRSIVGWVGAIAAAIAISVVATTFIVGGRDDSRLATQARTVAALEEVITATAAITAQPDAEKVTLAGTTDPSVVGSLDFSPSTTQMVVVATGLTPPSAGQEYRCWVQSGATRARLGKMYFSTDLAYWVGPAPAVAGLSDGALFGVSLVDVSGPGVETDPVLLGAL